ncbi:MAG: glycosyltransferase family 39 protein [Candidatus Woesearchaeota archaeon]|nr:MAG: glycosyltransferase family 39 protein [Candidatus Woesearchaeota archaeon]
MTEETQQQDKPKISFLRNYYFVGFLVILLFAIFLRFKYSFIDSIWNDEAVYIWNGIRVLLQPSHIFSTEFLSAGAIIPQLMITFFHIFTDSFTAGRIVAVIFSLLGIIFAYLLGKEVKGSSVGLIAAILITVNSIYWFIGSKALMDVPVAAATTIAAWALIKFEKNNTVKWAIIATILAVLPSFVKGVGSIVILLYILYFLITRRQKIFKDKLVWIALSAPLFILTVGNLIYFFIFDQFLTTNLFGRIFSLAGLSSPFGTTLQFFSFTLGINSFISWFLAIILVLGIILSFVYRKKEDLILLLWFFAFLAFVEFSLGRKSDPLPDPRNVLPALIIAYVIIGKTFNEIVEYLKILTKVKISMWIFVVLVVIISIPIYSASVNGFFGPQRNFSFSGYQEAGQWLKENVPKESLIYSTAPRQIRTFSERDYKRDLYNVDYGGTVIYLFHFKTFEEFAEEIKDKKDIYLHIDVFESGQPDWASPPNQEKIEALKTLGFIPIKEIQNQVGDQNIIIGIILHKT